MAFTISKLGKFPFLSSEANENLPKYCSNVIPSGELIQHFDKSLNLELTQYIGLTTIATNLDFIINFDIRVDDVFVCALMKCGSNWMQNIVWLLTHELDFEKNQNVDPSNLMCNFEDITKWGSFDGAELGNYWIKHFGNMESTRVFKSHCPIYFLPKDIWTKGAKIVYVVRNPKDSLVSEYHYIRNLFHCDITLDDVINGVTNDTWLFCPRFSHILNFWRVRHLPNVCFIAYEDLLSDTFNTIKKLSEFLNCHYSDEQLMKLVEYSSFDNMKKIKTINKESDVLWMENKLGKKRPDAEFTFFRKGKAGAYRDDLNTNQIKKLDDWIGKNLKDTDFKFQI